MLIICGGSNLYNKCYVRRLNELWNVEFLGIIVKFLFYGKGCALCGIISIQ